MKSRTDNGDKHATNRIAFSGSLRPLKRIRVHLGCGCVLEWDSDKAIAPRRDDMLYCFKHMQDVTVYGTEIRE